MHILTKIFIVLVTLLAVLMVPLVVVYAYNENSFQKQVQDVTAQADAARASFAAAQASQGAELTRKNDEIQALQAMNIDLRRSADRQSAEINTLQTQIAEAQSMDAEIRTQLATLTSAVNAGQQLTESLIGELRTLRKDSLASERQKVELDEALRDALAKLNAADEARRALQEELQRLKDEYAKSLENLQRYAGLHGPLESASRAVELGGLPPDRNLEASIITVRRSSDQTFAEINAGSRDGVKEGWVLTIGHDGNFIARLRVTTVDINRSTGIVELEDEYGRGRVDVGYRVYARSGR